MKRLIITIVLGVFLLICVAYISLFLWVNTKGKIFLAKKLEEKINSSVSIDSVRMKFPFRIYIENLKTKYFSLKNIEASWGGINPFSNELIINKLVLNQASVDVYLNKDKKVDTTVYVKTKEKSSRNIKKKRKFNLSVKNIVIKDSKLNIYDAHSTLITVLKDIYLKAKNIKYPELAKFFISGRISAVFKKTFYKNLLDFKGWIDYKNKNMDMIVNLNDFNYANLVSYYPSVLKPDRLGIEDATVSIRTELKAKNDDLVIKSRVGLGKVVFKESSDLPYRAEILKNVINVLKNKNDKKTYFEFEIKNKMSRLFNFSKKSADKNKVSNKPTGLKETVSAGSDIFEKINKIKNIKDKVDNILGTNR